MIHRSKRGRVRRWGPTGISLVDALVGLLLLSVGMMGTSLVFGSVVRSNNQSKHTNAATFLAQERMEELRGQTYHAVTVGTSVEEDVDGLFSRTTIVDWGPIPNTKSATVNVAWNDPYPHEITLTSMLHNPSYDDCSDGSGDDDHGDDDHGDDDHGDDDHGDDDHGDDDHGDDDHGDDDHGDDDHGDDDHGDDDHGDDDHGDDDHGDDDHGDDDHGDDDHGDDDHGDDDHGDDDHGDDDHGDDDGDGGGTHPACGGGGG